MCYPYELGGQLEEVMVDIGTWDGLNFNFHYEIIGLSL